MTLMKCLITDGGVFFFFKNKNIVVIPLNEDRSHVSQHCVYTFLPQGGGNVIFYILPLIYFNIMKFPPHTHKHTQKKRNLSALLLC